MFLILARSLLRDDATFSGILPTADFVQSRFC